MDEVSEFYNFATAQKIDPTFVADWMNFLSLRKRLEGCKKRVLERIDQIEAISGEMMVLAEEFLRIGKIPHSQQSDLKKATECLNADIDYLERWMDENVVCSECKNHAVHACKE